MTREKEMRAKEEEKERKQEVGKRSRTGRRLGSNCIWKLSTRDGVSFIRLSCQEERIHIDDYFFPYFPS